MGSRSIGRSGRVPSPTKGPAHIGTPGAATPPNCPEAVEVSGGFRDDITVGASAAITSAGGRPQLTVNGRTAPIVSTTPDLGLVTHCVAEGENYYGRVTTVSSDGFVASLNRA
jgi:hypothetical protein